MQKFCANPWCKQSFEITEKDVEFYDSVSPVFAGTRYSIPAPTLCPECRMQRRMAWRNERKMYHRTCNLTDRQIISIYSPEKQFPVFSQEAWWSDAWDPHSEGRSFDFQKSLFIQMKELQAIAPRIALLSTMSENSDFTHHASGNKNCFLSTTIFDCENAFFTTKAFAARDVTDCSYLLNGGELLYECFWAEKCYNSTYLQLCTNVQNSDFCFDCRNCSHCFMCSNLRNKEYYYYNKPLSPEEYFHHMQWRGSFEAHSRLRLEMKKMCEHAFHRALHIENSENVSGDFILQSRDVYDCYHIMRGEQLRYCTDCGSRNNCASSHCMDVFGMNSCDFIYEVQGQIHGNRTMACNLSYNISDSYYLDNCHNCKNCFGCIGLKNAQYCILNKQYTKIEYEEIVPRIIAKMSEENEWGEFFPVTMSPFGYNETIAQEYFPMEKNAVLKNGWYWYQTEEIPLHHDKKECVIPDNISDVEDGITHEILRCEVSGKPYRITPHELAFYRKMHIPVPRRCPDQRYNERIALRNPTKLWQRSCATCAKDIQTTYAPDRPEKVLCEECYLKEVY